MKIPTFPWQFWAVLSLIIPVGVGWYAFSMLNHLQRSECQAIDSAPDASDSTRLYCAQLIADGQSPDNLADAIRIANQVAPDTPLRDDSDRLIGQWTARLLQLAEQQYQQGNLDEAVAIAQQVPGFAGDYDTASQTIRSWQSAWSNAEEIYADAESALKQDNISEAIGIARRLLTIQNQYWQVTRYQELAKQIEETRQNQKKTAAKPSDRKPPLLDPPGASTDTLMTQWRQEREKEATTYLAQAQKFASAGNVDSLRQAISAAEQVLYGTAQYDQAQQSIKAWSQQIETMEDRPYLNRADQLARQGDTASLQAAINEANNIYYGRALYDEAQSRIGQWRDRVQQLQAQSQPTIPDYTIPPAPQPADWRSQ